MGGTYKKNLRAEKAKVKLKGAKLPKGLNVTKTEFKVRKITIREQLKESEVVNGYRQINLKETINRLQNHSANYRLEALRSLRDAIALNHPEIGGKLNSLMQGVAALCLDIDKETRRESFKTLNSLLNIMVSDEVAPFFHILSSYLRCAMTHIQPVLQEDSLLMLDVLLQHVPRLVATHSSKIFQNFLEMISKVRADGNHSNRALTVNLSHSQTTVKWRSKVLQRLQHMLQTLVEHNRQSTPTSIGDSADRSTALQVHTFKANDIQNYFIQRINLRREKIDFSTLLCHTTTTPSTSTAVQQSSNTDGISESTQIRNYLVHLMPLLLETWMEVRPSDSIKTGQVILSVDAAETLKVVLGIMENLWTLVELNEKVLNNRDLSDWFKDKYRDAFSTKFLQDSFPYQQVDNTAQRAKKKLKKSERISEGDQFCILQNTSISYLFCCFCTPPVEKDALRYANVLQYLDTVVCNLPSHSSEHFVKLEAALRVHLLQNGLELLNLEAEKTRLLLHSTMQAFLKNQFPNKDGIASRVLIMLCEIVQSQRLLEAYGAETFSEFLQHLPNLLLQPTISESAVVAMSALGKYQNTAFLKALDSLISPVIENIQKIQVLGALNAFEGKKHIMNLFYWTEAIRNANETLALVQKIEEHISDKRIANYFNYILSITGSILQ